MNSANQNTTATNAAPSGPETNLQQLSRRGFATVQLTMLSIVVALVLENLLGTLFDLPSWTLLIGLQSLDVLASAFSMWIGFAFALTVVNKQPSLSDFLNPFVMLIFLSLAVRCIATGNLAGFFLAGACGTLSSAINLWSDVRGARAAGSEDGPTGILYLLLAAALVELTAAVTLWFAPTATLLAIAFVLANTLLQAINSTKSVKAWRYVTA